MTTEYSPLPDEDHILRHVPSSKLIRDENQVIIGCFSEAFKRRDNEEALSVTWIEYFDGTRQEQISNAVNAIRRDIDVRPKSGFALANVGTVKSICLSFDYKVRILSDPTPNNPAHSVITQLPREEAELLELLATCCSEIIPASSIST
jgi:hypothetical protein